MKTPCRPSRRWTFVPQLLLDELTPVLALLSRFARAPRRRRLERRQQRQKPLVVEGLNPLGLDNADVLSGADVASRRLWIDPHRSRDGLHAASAQPLSDGLFDLEHRDLSKRHRSSLAVGRLERGKTGSRGLVNFLQTTAPHRGGILLKKSSLKRGECF
jgi:hypothetical protein